eukprot:TRINITY_DN15831_c0_g1_i1.p1 TRINITY_DN15831_c0_g1~~TRINITY_DN15831_c0_g1_i1.p1  ORF type:complete len:245 (-),score=34.79 TRINITY_DN15831_c0_g1_i1:82-741(-)
MAQRTPVDPRRMSESSATASSAEVASGPRKNVTLKVGMLGDAAIGKTSMMVKYVDNRFDEDYIETLAVTFMEKTVTIRTTDILFSIWDLGGQKEFQGMLPLVCNEAAALLFMFDLSRKTTLHSVREWYKSARGLNRTAIPILVGTKYDKYTTLPPAEQDEIAKTARRYAKAMRAPLVFCSSSHSINVQKIFKIVLSKAFDLKLNFPQITTIGEPLVEWE